MEIFAKAPNLRTVIIHAAFADRVAAYNGREGWVAAIEKPLPLMPMTGGNLEGQKIDAMMSFPAQSNKLSINGESAELPSTTKPSKCSRERIRGSLL